MMSVGDELKEQMTAFLIRPFVVRGNCDALSGRWQTDENN